MDFNRIKRISNIIFYVSVIYTIGVLLKTYFDRMKLPDGVCPLESNNIAIYIGIGLLVISLISSTIVSIMEKKNKDKQ